MVYLYATMNQSEAYLKKGKRLDPKLDNAYLKNKVVVMDEEFYIRFAPDFDSNVRIITVGENDLSRICDVESYKTIESIVNSPVFKSKEKDLYFMGNYKFLQKVVPYAGGIVANIIDDQNTEEIGNIYFPSFDDHNFENIKADRLSDKITRITNLRVAAYGTTKKQIGKVKKKHRR